MPIVQFLAESLGLPSPLARVAARRSGSVIVLIIRLILRV